MYFMHHFSRFGAKYAATRANVVLASGLTLLSTTFDRNEPPRVSNTATYLVERMLTLATGCVAPKYVSHKLTSVNVELGIICGYHCETCGQSLGVCICSERWTFC